MILRPTLKLARKLRTSVTSSLPVADNVYADWSANLFTAGRFQYIILTHSTTLYSIILQGRGITDTSDLLDQGLSYLRQVMEGDDLGFHFERFVAPAAGVVELSKALSRSTTGSMNDLIFHARFLLLDGLSPLEVSMKLHRLPMSQLGTGPGRLGYPDVAFRNLKPPGQSAPEA